MRNTQTPPMAPIFERHAAMTKAPCSPKLPTYFLRAAKNPIAPGTAIIASDSTGSSKSSRVSGMIQNARNETTGQTIMMLLSIILLKKSSPKRC